MRLMHIKQFCDDRVLLLLRIHVFYCNQVKLFNVYTEFISNVFA